MLGKQQAQGTFKLQLEQDVREKRHDKKTVFDFLIIAHTYALYNNLNIWRKNVTHYKENKILDFQYIYVINT